MSNNTMRALQRAFLLLYWRHFCRHGANQGMSKSCAVLLAALRGPPVQRAPGADTTGASRGAARGIAPQ